MNGIFTAAANARTALCSDANRCLVPSCSNLLASTLATGLSRAKLRRYGTRMSSIASGVASDSGIGSLPAAFEELDGERHQTCAAGHRGEDLSHGSSGSRSWVEDSSEGVV